MQRHVNMVFVLAGGGIGERGNLMHAAFDAFTGGRVAWAKLPDVRERVFVGDR